MGTCRMGDDPATSVVDPWQRFHDVENMVCTDSSVFPTSTGYGPTLTIVALALRACRAACRTPPFALAYSGSGVVGCGNMDLRHALPNISLPRPGRRAEHRLGDLCSDKKPVVLVFLRHFGCLHCREHAVELRDRYDDLQAKGVDLVAVGTGDQRYAGAFVRDEQIPYLVLVDEDAPEPHKPTHR